jgi:hypothetical protein
VLPLHFNHCQISFNFRCHFSFQHNFRRRIHHELFMEFQLLRFISVSLGKHR